MKKGFPIVLERDRPFDLPSRVCQRVKRALAQIFWPVQARASVKKSGGRGATVQAVDRVLPGGGLECVAALAEAPTTTWLRRSLPQAKCCGREGGCGASSQLGWCCFVCVTVCVAVCVWLCCVHDTVTSRFHVRFVLALWLPLQHDGCATLWLRARYVAFTVLACTRCHT